jgi:NADPH:quinone reductase-like Zn-dependent oxidoreductase
MKAVQYKAFGGSEVLEMVDIPSPSIQNEKDILVQVKAASVNPVDTKIRMGFMQQIRPVEMPFVPGSDAAGIIVAVGTGVTGFKVGDEVIAVPMKGAYAEYVVVNEAFVLPKPANLSFEEATSVAINIGAAQSVLFNEGKLEKEQKVLIQGGAGAAGAAMVQMAKGAGAYVIVTASGKGIDLVKSLGADEVIDYKTEDVTALVKDVDLVVDCVGGESQVKLFEVVKKGGKLLSIGGVPPSPELAQQYGVEARFVVSDLSATNLKAGLKLVQNGTLKPLVSKTFPLEKAAQAQDFLAAGGVNGKVVLVVA